VVLPFYAAGQGFGDKSVNATSTGGRGGHSGKGAREAFLRGTVETLARDFSHVVIFTCHPADYSNVRALELPADVVLLQLQKPILLLTAASVEAARRISTREWDADFVLFTEADNAFVIRHPEAILAQLQSNPFVAVSPHRLAVMSPPLAKYSGKLRDTEVVDGASQAGHLRCCALPICHTRVHWKPLMHPQVVAHNVYGTPAILGSHNMQRRTFNLCNVTVGPEECPEAPRGAVEVR